MRKFKEKNIQLLCSFAILIVIIFQYNVYAQDDSSDEKIIKKQTVEKKTKTKNVKKNDDRSAGMHKQELNETKSSSLLFINNDEYKYLRIPGYTPDKNNSEKKTIIETDNKGETVVDQGSGKQGLFGLSKKSSDILVKISFILFIIIIFILYRVRNNKSSKKNVLRSILK